MEELEHALELGRRIHWNAPPEQTSRRAWKMPAGERVGQLRTDEITRVRPADVRSRAMVGDPETLLWSHSSPHVDASFALTTRHGLQEIEGRAWRPSVDHADSADEAIEIHWVQADHVLGSVRVTDGEVFRFEGAPVKDWHLEILVSGGRAIVLPHPTA